MSKGYMVAYRKGAPAAQAFKAPTVANPRPSWVELYTDPRFYENVPPRQPGARPFYRVPRNPTFGRRVPASIARRLPSRILWRLLLPIELFDLGSDLGSHLLDRVRQPAPNKLARFHTGEWTTVDDCGGPEEAIYSGYGLSWCGSGFLIGDPGPGPTIAIAPGASDVWTWRDLQLDQTARRYTGTRVRRLHRSDVWGIPNPVRPQTLMPGFARPLRTEDMHPGRFYDPPVRLPWSLVPYRTVTDLHNPTPSRYRDVSMAPPRERVPDDIVVGRDSVTTRPPDRVRQPPKKNERERKQRASDARSYRAVGRLMGFATESLDIINPLWDALPVWDRTTHRIGTTRDGEPIYWRPRVDVMLEDLWQHYDAIDIGKAIEGIAANQVEDFVIGKFGNAAQKQAKPILDRLGRPVGFGTGPAL